jgi:hypothetical protein
MEITGKVHCFFEQSGTFKNEFKKLGIPAEDYDIQNNFGETDHVVDLFAEIEKAYEEGASVFDSITSDDLIVAFFPCIYFSCMSQMLMSWTHKNHKNLSAKARTDAILERSANREKFFALAVKLHSICYQRELRMVMENPWSEQTFLKQGFLQPPTVVDGNRTLRGDYFIKPTAYWFVNCKPSAGRSFQSPKEVKRLMWEKKSPVAGMCSEDRSLISPDYARNFICDFIIGKQQPHTLTTLF